MRRCCICLKRYVSGSGSFFEVPKDEGRRRQWMKICRRKLAKHDVLCADHFLEKEIVKAGKRCMLLPCAVPYLPQNLNTGSEDFSLDMDHDNTPLRYMPTKRHPGPLDEPYFESGNRGHKRIHMSSQSDPFGAPVNMGTQTDSVVFEGSFSAMCDEQRRTIKRLENELRDMRVKMHGLNLAVENMRKIFTEGQVRKMMGGHNVNWQWGDIASALVLHQKGPKTYKHLYNMGFPLPSVSSLQRWCSTYDVNEGVLKTAIEFLKNKPELSEEDKICVLTFDELKVREPNQVPKTAQFVMARGLRKSWKQVVFYNYDSKMKKKSLHTIIGALKETGFPVVALVCNISEENKSLWQELNVTIDKPWFSNPANPEQKIFAFANPMHLLKLVRNQLLDTGLVVNKEHLKPCTFVELLNYHKSDTKRPVKLNLTDEHFSENAKEDIKLVTEFFSKTTTNALKRCHTMKVNMYKPLETAEFLLLINFWFDVMNSSTDNLNRPGKEAYGSVFPKQKQILQRVSKLMSQPMVPHEKEMALFQMGILVTNSSLEMLHEYIKDHYMPVILTRRLSHDVLEELKASLYSNNLYPNSKELKQRLRRYILARNTDSILGFGEVTKVEPNENPTEETKIKNDVDNNIKSITKKDVDMEQSDQQNEEIDINDLIDMDVDDEGILFTLLNTSPEILPEKPSDSKSPAISNNKVTVSNTTSTTQKPAGAPKEVTNDIIIEHLFDLNTHFTTSILQASTTSPNLFPI